jgi:hypothetical protein
MGVTLPAVSTMRQSFPRASSKRTGASHASADVFASIDGAPLIEDPYPHLVVEDALPKAIANTLVADMPPLYVFTRGRPPGSNVRFRLPSPRALSDPRISSAWKDALRACVDASQEFLERTLSRLGGHLLALFPDFESRFGPIEELRAVPRDTPNRKRNEVGLDAQLIVNSPPLVDGTSVRGPHLDWPDKLISALLYLRPEEDDSVGGDLELYTPVDGTLLFDAHNEVPLEQVRRVRTYPYRHNLMILPLATPLGLHGVSPRGRTSRPRYHLHVAGELTGTLFDIKRAT